MNRNEIQSFSWADMDLLDRRVAKMIKSDRFLPELIVGILRCGMVSAVHLAYLLSVGLVRGLHVRTTPSDDILVEKVIEPVVESDEVLNIARAKKILIVDAVMASGTTMALSIRAIQAFAPKEVRTAVIVDWSSSPYKCRSGTRPSIDYIGTTADKWPEFPWEH